MNLPSTLVPSAPALGTGIAPQERAAGRRRAASWLHAVRRRWPLFAVVFGLTFALAFAALSRIPRSYTTDVHLIAGVMNADAARADRSDGTSSYVDDVMRARGEHSVDTFAQLLRETDVAERVVRDQRLAMGPAALLDRVSVRPIVNTTVLDLRVRWGDPEGSARIANALAGAFVEEERSFVAAGAGNVARALAEQVPAAQERLRRAQAALDAYAVRADLVDVTHQTQSALDAVYDVEGRVAKLQLDLRQATAERTAIARLAAGTPAVVVGRSDDAVNPVLAQLRARAAQLDVDLAAARERYTPQHPVVRDLEVQRAQVQRAMAQQAATVRAQTEVVPNPLAQQLGGQLATVTAQIDGDRAQIAELARQRDALRGSVRTLPERTSHYLALRRDATLAEDVYGSLRHRLADAQLLEATAFSDLAITQPARADAARVFPDRGAVLGLALLAALLAAVFATVFAELVRNRFSGEADVQRELGLPLLAAIPELPGTGAPRRFAALSARAPPSAPFVRSAMIESFFALVMAIRYSSEVPLRTVAVTSPSQGDGKSSIALNLALTMAEIEPRVLLVDADMRLPSLHAKLKIRNERGLSDVLVGRAVARDAIQATPHPGLDVLTAGTRPPNPLALLQGKAFPAMLAELGAVYRAIVVDAPALDAVLDGAAVASVADGTILVVARNRTGTRAAKRALERLRSTGARNIVGTVMNRKDVTYRPSSYYDDGVLSPLYLHDGLDMLGAQPD